MHDHNSRQFEPSANHGAEGGAKHSPTPPANPPSTSEDVMDVLAAVEQQLNRLKTAHKGQDDAFSSMNARSQSLREAEQGLEQTRKEIAKQQQSLAEEWEKLAAQQHELE